MMIGVLHEARIHLHLPPQNGLELLRHLVPRRDVLVACGQLAVLWDDPELLLPGKGLFAQLVPPCVELALVLVGPLPFGVWQGPPKALDDPNPASSMRMIRTFGAASGGRRSLIGGNLVSGSLAS